MPEIHARIVQAAEVLLEGGVVAFPTETVYGLGALHERVAAVERIYAMKGRPKSKPLIVHVESELAIDVFAVDVPEYVHKLAAAFWPGPLTLVVKRSAEVPDVVTGGGDTVALRAPDHPIALELLAVLSRSLNRPAGIAAPSANRFGETPAVTAAEVIEAFGGVGTDVDVPDLLLDGGLCPKGVPSTVLSCVGETPRLLRRGTIGVEEIERVIGCSVDSSGA